jgi:hypothetical protein
MMIDEDLIFDVAPQKLVPSSGVHVTTQPLTERIVAAGGASVDLAAYEAAAHAARQALTTMTPKEFRPRQSGSARTRRRIPDRTEVELRAIRRRGGRANTRATPTKWNRNVQRPVPVEFDPHLLVEG